MHEAQVGAAVRGLPVEARVILMLGPIAMTAPEDVGDCRVCVALERWAALGGYMGGPPPSGRLVEALALSLFDWHQGWDLMGTRGFLLGRGAEVYRRCCVIYEAAGWRGPETVVLGPHEAVRRC